MDRKFLNTCIIVLFVNWVSLVYGQIPNYQICNINDPSSCQGSTQFFGSYYYEPFVCSNWDNVNDSICVPESLFGCNADDYCKNVVSPAVNGTLEFCYFYAMDQYQTVLPNNEPMALENGFTLKKRVDTTPSSTTNTSPSGDDQYRSNNTTTMKNNGSNDNPLTSTSLDQTQANETQANGVIGESQISENSVPVSQVNVMHCYSKHTENGICIKDWHCTELYICKDGKCTLDSSIITKNNLKEKIFLVLVVVIPLMFVFCVSIFIYYGKRSYAKYELKNAQNSKATSVGSVNNANHTRSHNHSNNGYTEIIKPIPYINGTYPSDTPDSALGSLLNINIHGGQGMNNNYNNNYKNNGLNNGNLKLDDLDAKLMSSLHSETPPQHFSNPRPKTPIIAAATTGATSYAPTSSLEHEEEMNIFTEMLDDTNKLMTRPPHPLIHPKDSASESSHMNDVDTYYSHEMSTKALLLNKKLLNDTHANGLMSSFSSSKDSTSGLIDESDNSLSSTTIYIDNKNNNEFRNKNKDDDIQQPRRGRSPSRNGNENFLEKGQGRDEVIHDSKQSQNDSQKYNNYSYIRPLKNKDRKMKINSPTETSSENVNRIRERSSSKGSNRGRGRGRSASRGRERNKSVTRDDSDQEDHHRDNIRTSTKDKKDNAYDRREGHYRSISSGNGRKSEEKDKYRVKKINERSRERSNRDYDERNRDRFNRHPLDYNEKNRERSNRQKLDINHEMNSSSNSSNSNSSLYKSGSSSNKGKYNDHDLTKIHKINTQQQPLLRNDSPHSIISAKSMSSGDGLSLMSSFYVPDYSSSLNSEATKFSPSNLYLSSSSNTIKSFDENKTNHIPGKDSSDSFYQKMSDSVLATSIAAAPNTKRRMSLRKEGIEKIEKNCKKISDHFSNSKFIKKFNTNGNGSSSGNSNHSYGQNPNLSSSNDDLVTLNNLHQNDSFNSNPIPFYNSPYNFADNIVLNSSLLK